MRAVAFVHPSGRVEALVGLACAALTLATGLLTSAEVRSALSSLAPVVAFLVTKRVCMGLQRKDRDKVLHGRESGTIKRLPHGEFVEVHEPLAQDQLFTLTQHEQNPPYEIGPLVDANGVRRPVKPRQRVRARLARVMFGSESHIPKPTVEEFRELTSGDHHH